MMIVVKPNFTQINLPISLKKILKKEIFATW